MAKKKRGGFGRFLGALTGTPYERLLKQVEKLANEHADDERKLAKVLKKLVDVVGTAYEEEEIDEDDKLRNSALLYEAGKDKPVIYDKTHLVPFGEYVPWRFIPFIDAIAGPLDFHKGKAVYTVPLDGIGKSLILICYEAIFPQLVARADQRPDILINMTNDAWFGHTAGPYQHLAQTRMSAISYGIGMLRVANTGISAAFDAKGRRLVQIPLGQAGFRDVRVPAPMPASYFAKFGLALFFIFTSLLVICGLTLDRFHRNRQ